MAQPHISLAAEKIGEIAGWPITNSLLLTWIVMGALTAFAYLATKRMSLVPNNIQSIAEVILDGIYNLFSSVVGPDHIKKFFPLLATIFLFIVVANWSGLLPGVGTIGIKHEVSADSEGHSSIISKVVASEPVLPKETVPTDTHSDAEVVATGDEKHSEKETVLTPLFRGPTADLNTTLALAIFAVASVQYYGIATLGGTYLKKFINFSDPIMFGVGLLEIVSEFSRILSFAFRLFGNIFAGEVLLTVIAFLMPVIAPLPFLGLELFVGFIQALVFSMLTAVFLSMATVSHEH